MRLVDVIRRVVRTLGIDVVRADPPNTIEGHLKRLLPALGVDIVVDVGAHYGEYARLLRGIGYSGRILSFEPVAANFARLRDAMGGDDSWKGFCMALGTGAGTHDINVLAATDLSSFRTPTSNATAWFGSAGHVVRTESVTVRRLDDVLGERFALDRTARAFLKLDTRGFDLDVLRGATDTLGHVVGLQAEIAVRPLYEGVPLFPDNLRPFLECGFELTGLFGVAREPDGIAQIEFDCVMRRPDAWLAALSSQSQTTT